MPSTEGPHRIGLLLGTTHPILRVRCRGPNPVSHQEHKAKAAVTANVRVVVVSSSRGLDDDISGSLIADMLENAGHRVFGRSLVSDDLEQIRTTVRNFCGEGLADVVVITGGTGVSGSDCTPEAIQPLFDRELTGFGELFRMLSFHEIGPSAMLSRATAGMVGAVPVFALPGSPAACRLGLEKLIIPEIGHLIGVAHQDEPAPQPVAATVASQSAPTASNVEDNVSEDKANLPVPSGSLGHVGRKAFTIKSEEVVTRGPAAEPETIPDSGWKRAVYEIKGEVLRDGAREDIPQNVEKLSPFVNVLETAGEVAVLKLPSGIRYGIYGFPDLQRINSKVIAVGWGEPLAEVLALHRFPIQTGICIDEARGLLPSRSSSVAETALAVTGRAPRDTSGSIFAISGDEVWIERGSSVFKWDGSNEKNEGMPKQVLTSLVLHWSNR